MTGYHLYFRNEDDRLGGVVARVCDSDEQALEWARSLLEEHAAVEVWRGEQCVATVSAVAEPA